MKQSDDLQQEKVVAVIPVRGGSKGLPRKNILPLAGKPLLAYSIEPAQKAVSVDRVIVCTEDREIAEIAKSLGAEVPFMRPDSLGEDNVGCNEVMIWTVGKLFELNLLTSRNDIIVYLQATDLFKRAEWIDECVGALRNNPGYDAAFIGCIDHKNYWERTPAGDYIPYGGGPHPGHDNRQIKPEKYREDTGMGAAIRAYVWTEMRQRLGEKNIVIPKSYVFFDIHDAEDLFLAEQYLKYKQNHA